MNVTSNSQWQRGFWNLMVTQFQNAFSDNALKNLIILLVLVQPMSPEDRSSHVAMTGALFSAPFILFAMLGGWLADRFSKQLVMSTVKLAEIAIMLLAAVALGLHYLPLQLASIFLMGCHSAIFGPSKYGILPEVLPLEKLSWGNGILELLTFLGIILGTVTGSILADHLQAMPAISGVLLAILAVVGWHFSRGIPKVPAANPTCPLRINPITDLWRQLMLMKLDRDLWRANWGNTGFFFIAALVQMNLVVYGQEVLHLTATKNGLLGAALAIGIGVGSVVAGYASRGRIEYRLVPIGAAIMALATIPMGIDGISTIGFSLALVLLGMGGGLFIVPIAAVLQHRPAPENKGAVQGASSVLSFVGILSASGVQWLVSRKVDAPLDLKAGDDHPIHLLLNHSLNLTPGQVFWFCGATALVSGAYVAFSRREEILRKPPLPASSVH